MSRSQSATLDPESAYGATEDGRAIRRRSLHRYVTDRLRDMIVESELRPGDRIDEQALCDLFGISRTPLREALKVLASEGLIELRPNRGARVAPLTEQGVLQLFEVAAGVERMAAELAVARASDEDLTVLRQVHDRMLRYHAARRRSDYFRLNHRIHNAVVELAGNTVLTEVHAQLMTKIRRARFTAILSQERWDESVCEHENLMCALEARDPAAGNILRDHVLATGKVVLAFVREQIDQDQEPPRRRRVRYAQAVSPETRQRTG